MPRPRTTLRFARRALTSAIGLAAATLPALVGLSPLGVLYTIDTAGKLVWRSMTNGPALKVGGTDRVAAGGLLLAGESVTAGTERLTMGAAVVGPDPVTVGARSRRQAPLDPDGLPGRAMLPPWLLNRPRRRTLR